MTVLDHSGSDLRELEPSDTWRATKLNRMLLPFANLLQSVLVGESASERKAESALPQPSQLRLWVPWPQNTALHVGSVIQGEGTAVFGKGHSSVAEHILLCALKVPNSIACTASKVEKVSHLPACGVAGSRVLQAVLSKMGQWADFGTRQLLLLRKHLLDVRSSTEAIRCTE